MLIPFCMPTLGIKTLGMGSPGVSHLDPRTGRVLFKNDYHHVCLHVCVCVVCTWSIFVAHPARESQKISLWQQFSLLSWF